MKKVICKIEYDTDASELIQKKVFGVFGAAASLPIRLRPSSAWLPTR